MCNYPKMEKKADFLILKYVQNDRYLQMLTTKIVQPSLYSTCPQSLQIQWSSLTFWDSSSIALL